MPRDDRDRAADALGPRVDDQVDGRKARPDQHDRVVRRQAVQHPVPPRVLSIRASRLQRLGDLEGGSGPGVSEREHGPIGPDAIPVAADEGDAPALLADVDDLAPDELDRPRAPAGGVLQQRFEVLSIEPPGGERPGMRVGVPDLEPLQEMRGLVGQRAHHPGRDVQQVMGRRGAVRHPPRKPLAPLDEEDPDRGRSRQAGQVDGHQGTAEAGPDDRDHRRSRPENRISAHGLTCLVLES